MKEQWSVSNDKLLNLEKGLPYKAENLCVEIVKVNNVYNRTVLGIVLILYLASLSLTGWSCYLVWQISHIRLFEQELIPDKNMNESVISSSDDDWNKRMTTDIDIINEAENDTVLMNNQIQNVMDTINDNEKSGSENLSPLVTTPETVLSEKSELKTHRTKEDNIDASTKTFDVTTPLIGKETTNSESTVSSLSSQENEYQYDEESQQFKTDELFHDNSQNYDNEYGSEEFFENADSAIIEDTRDTVQLIKSLILLTQISEQMEVLDETETSSESQRIPETTAPLFDVNF
ncbi:uncharacterized protein LOC116430742 [Nomia melanderi]|uniref:uncharacterized protein LOC116430742 n=1 Tax=Nomia melanderi TaxID=2448451 RepID=UPI003FCD5DE5